MSLRDVYLTGLRHVKRSDGIFVHSTEGPELGLGLRQVFVGYAALSLAVLRSNSADSHLRPDLRGSTPMRFLSACASEGRATGYWGPGPVKSIVRRRSRPPTALYTWPQSGSRSQSSHVKK